MFHEGKEILPNIGVQICNIHVYAQRKNRITLPAGTLIVKEYRGETYKIKVTDEDFILNGIHYSSLAKIARFITGGTNWNVQRFFKLSETVQ